MSDSANKSSKSQATNDAILDPIQAILELDTELTISPERNSAVLGFICDLVQRNTTLAKSEELAQAQHKQLKKLRENEAALKTEIAQIRVDAERARKDLLEQKNLEIEDLRFSEKSLKLELNQLRVEFAMLNQAISDKSEAISRLQAMVDGNETKQAQEREMSNRKLAKIVDSSWAKDLEIEQLKANQTAQKKKINELEAECAKRAQKVDEANNALAQARNLVDAKHSEFEAYKRDSAQRFVEVSRSCAAESENLENVCSELRQQIAHLRAESSSYQADLKEAGRTAAALQSSYSSLQLEFERTRSSQGSQIAELSSECRYKSEMLRDAQKLVASLQVNVAEQKNITEGYSLKLSEIQTQLATKNAEHAALVDKFTKSQSALDELRAALTKSQADLVATSDAAKKDALALHTKSQQELLAAREAARDALRSREKELQFEIDHLSFEISENAKSFANATSMIEQNKTAIDQYESTIEHHENTIEQYKMTIAQHEQTVTKLSSALQQVESALEDMQEAHHKAIQNYELNNKKLTIEFTAKIETAENECIQLRRQLETRSSYTDIEVSQLEARALTQERREMQLRSFANSMNKEKAELLRVSKQLVQEIQLLGATHPLKDYLAATEFELSKAEIQLKTTPMVSPDRAGLESYLARLVEQRDFLNAVLANSLKEFERRAADVSRLVSNGTLAPVPPPPPPTHAAAATKAQQVAKSTLTSIPTPKAVPPSPQWESPSVDII